MYSPRSWIGFRDGGLFAACSAGSLCGGWSIQWQTPGNLPGFCLKIHSDTQMFDISNLLETDKRVMVMINRNLYCLYRQSSSLGTLTSYNLPIPIPYNTSYSMRKDSPPPSHPLKSFPSSAPLRPLMMMELSNTSCWSRRFFRSWRHLLLAEHRLKVKCWDHTGSCGALLSGKRENCLLQLHQHPVKVCYIWPINTPVGTKKNTLLLNTKQLLIFNIVFLNFTYLTIDFLCLGVFMSL